MENSHIQWTTHSFNPWIGCTKVSPGCAHCYAEARDIRFANGTHWGKGKPRQRTSAGNWREPRRWNAAQDILHLRAGMQGDQTIARQLKNGELPLPRPRVFSASLSDWLDDEVPIEWLADFLHLVGECQHLDWLLLTKRPENWRTRVTAALVCHESEYGGSWLHDWLDTTKEPPANIWMGTSVENQECADERIPELISIPARVRFLSCEPLLGPVNLERVNDDGASYLDPLHGVAFVDGRNEPVEVGRIHWVIVGGESGKNARRFAVDWALALIAQCRAAGVAPFVKQLGTRPFHDFVGYPGSCIDHGLHLRDAKGGDWNEWPAELKVREFPA